MKELLKSKKFTAVFVLLGVVILILVSFSLGLRVGFKKAMFSCEWGREYRDNFMPPRPNGPMGMKADFEDRGLRNGHGISGEVISLGDNSLIIKDKNNQENTVNVTDRTIVMSRMNKISWQEIKTGDNLVVVGRPNNGVVEADLIRIFSDNSK